MLVYSLCSYFSSLTLSENQRVVRSSQLISSHSVFCSGCVHALERDGDRLCGECSHVYVDAPVASSLLFSGIVVVNFSYTPHNLKMKW